MNKDYGNLISELESLLEDREHKIDHLSNTDPLFLLLTSKRHLAAFSLLNGDPSNFYEKALQKFRELYATRSSQWADYDLTLVLCRHDTNTAFNDTYNSIEIDPYFCQKFVIDFGNLRNDLKRLPFIPLSPKVVEIERPISAQTFLMKHGVNTELARYLAVPHKKREEGILEGCIKGELGKPEWHKNESAHFIKPAIEDKKNIVRLKTLAINNFRAYRKETFDLDADLIVFFGPNGFGKTSAFDAIDFICTGSVGRFDERHKKDSRKIPKILGHLDSKVGDALITAMFSIDGTELTIERNLDNRSYAHVNNEEKSRAETLLQLTGLMEERPDMRVDNLINLFRATHLFGQEFQALTSDVRDKSHIHEDTVSRMLAIQDYVEAINKTQKVTYLIDSVIRTKNDAISSFEQDKAAKESELHQLMSTAKDLESPDSVTTVGKELFVKIKDNIDVSEQPDKYDQEIVRTWRASIEVEMHTLSNKLSLVKDLEEKLPEMQKHKKLLQEKIERLSKTKELIGQYEKEIADKIPLINELKLKSRELTDENKKNVLRGEHLKWLLKATDDIKHISSQINELDKTYNDTQKRCHEVIETASQTKTNTKNIEEVIGKETTKLQVLDQGILKLGELQEGKDDWLRLLKLCKEKEDYLQTNEGVLDNAKKDLAGMRQNYEMTVLELKKLQEEIERLQKVQSERLNILDRIQQYNR